jgi:hypothetical protein
MLGRMADQPVPRRRFQFRLRTLFVIATIVAVQCAVCLPMLKEWEARREYYREQLQLMIRAHSGKPQEPATTAALKWMRRHAD